MANYTPDATNPDRPTDGDLVQIPEELRAIKARIIQLDEEKADATFQGQTVYPTSATGVAASGSTTVDLSRGTFQHYRIVGNTTFTFTHPTPADDAVPFFSLKLTNGGNYTVTWPTGTRWPYGANPALTEDGVDILTFWKPFPGATFWEGGHPIVDLREPEGVVS